MLTTDDRTQLRREIVVAVVGILIGVLTTFFNKLLETEYIYQRNLKVLEYSDECYKTTADTNLDVTCKLKLKASGLKPIKQIRLSVIAQPSGQNADVLQVDPHKGLVDFPTFAPPYPLPIIADDRAESGFAAVDIPLLRAGQGLQWTVEIKSRHNIDPDRQVFRTVSTGDDTAQIEQGSSWRWRRWTTLGSLSLIIPLVIVVLLLLIAWTLRAQPQGCTTLFE